MSDDFLKAQIVEAKKHLSCDKETPEMGVHVMSEYIYCARAGIIATESSQQDSGMERIPAPALGGIQLFDVDNIEANLEAVSTSLRQSGLLLSAVVLVVIIAAVFDRNLAIVLLFCSTVVSVVSWRLWARFEVRIYLYYRRELREAREAPKREPNWNLNCQQAVNWWELLQSGFESRALKDAHYSHEIRLRGRPWRILRRGNMHLPVLCIKVENYDPKNLTQVRLREQQRARIAAYAFLIEICERGQADWAIVLFNHSVDGIAVPIGNQEWHDFREGLVEAREHVRKLNNDMRYMPSPADHGNACFKCPLGRPRRVGSEPTVLSGVQLPAYATSNKSGGKEFHCSCGDRFQFVPKHRDAVKLGLLS